jgi:hypothetical protein
MAKDESVNNGDKHYTVRGTVEYEVQVYEVASESDAKKVVNSLELKLSPWANSTADLVDQNIEIDDIEQDGF